MGADKGSHRQHTFSRVQVLVQFRAQIKDEKRRTELRFTCQTSTRQYTTCTAKGNIARTAFSLSSFNPP